MPKNSFVRYGLQAAFFIAVCTLTLFAVQRWGPKGAEGSASKTGEKPRGDTIEGVQGLNAGETVTLPELSDLGDGTVRPGGAGRKYTLIAFFSSSCPGCVVDSDMWRDLNVETPKRDASFYLINVGDEPEAVKKFAAAHDLGGLPLLFDPQRKVGHDLRVNFVPQYVLLSAEGRVIKRWDGVQNYDRRKGAEQLDKFFAPAGGQNF